MTVIVIREAGAKARFDAGAEMWSVTTPEGETSSARAVIDVRRSDDDTVAMHGRPNYFRVPGPHVERQLRYVQRCLDLLEKSGSTRMEARSRVIVRRRGPQRVGARFQLSQPVPADDDVYSGPAVLVLAGLAGVAVQVRARLTGHVDPNDGRFHWRGTVTGALPDDALKGQRAVMLSIGERYAPGQLTERTPWGGYTVVGVGDPPFAMTGSAVNQSE